MNPVHQDATVKCPAPNCSSSCHWCLGNGVAQDATSSHQAFYKTDGAGRGIATSRRFDLTGYGKEEFRQLALTVMELVGFREALGCAFTAGYAWVEDREGRHAPYTNAAARRPLEPWAPTTCIERLWSWITGTLPNDIKQSVVPPRQNYVHVEPSCVQYPEAPVSRSRSVQGFMVSNLVSWGSGIIVRPVWVYPSKEKGE